MYHGVDTKKPTIITHQKLNLEELKDARCDHEKVERISTTGKKYWSPTSQRSSDGR